MKKRFTLTFQIVTEESAEHGDFARHGYLTRDLELPATKAHAYLPKNPAKHTLRDAVAKLLESCQEGPIEADSCPISKTMPPRWFNASSGWNGDGEAVTIALHLPESVTPSSAIRIARLVRCYGLRG